MQLLKQSTAFTDTIGPILDADGVEYTGAVIGDLSISKNGTEAAMASAATLTHISNGHYTLVGTTGNSDTIGRVVIRVNKANHQMPRATYEVLAASTFDAIVTNAAGATGGMLYNGSNTGAVIPTVTTLTNLPAITAGWLTATGIASDAITDAKVASDVTIASVTGAVGSVTGAVGSVTGAVGSVTGNVGGSVASIATGGIAAASFASGAITAASIASDAITDAKVASDVTISAVTGAVGSVTGNVGGNVTGSVGSVSGNVGGNIVGSVASVAGNVGGSVASVVGNVGGNVTGSIGSVATGGITATSIAADAITAAKIADGAIDSATFASGTTIPRVALADVLTVYTGNTPQTGDSYARIGVNGAGLTAADDAVIAAIAALNNLSQANVRSAVGLASANLDTQLDALPTNSELTTALGTADDAVLAAIAALNNLSNAQLTSAIAAGDDATLAAIAALSIPTAAQNAAGLLDLVNGVETGLTVRNTFRLVAAAVSGLVSGGGSTTITIKNAVAGDKSRIVATVTSDGDRTAITYDLS